MNRETKQHKCLVAAFFAITLLCVGLLTLPQQVHAGFLNTISSSLNSISANVIDSIDQNSKYFNTSVVSAKETISKQILTSASNAKLSLLTNAKYFNTKVNKASQQTTASVMDAITQSAQNFNNAVNRAIDTTFSIFSKPEEEPSRTKNEALVRDRPQEEETDKVVIEETSPSADEANEVTPLEVTPNQSSAEDTSGQVERIVETPNQSSQSSDATGQAQRILAVSGISKEEMNTAMNQLENKLFSEMYQLTSTNAGNIVNTYKVISQSNKIDKLGSVTISNSTISGTLSGLTDAHIPDGITASNYLPLSGGTLTGNLSAEYFTAT